MRVAENILQALYSLKANKMRSLLTMLGIIIGIAAVIAIITVGDSLTNFINESMQSFGVNNVTLSLQAKKPERLSGGGYSVVINEKDFITNEMLEALREEYPDEVDAYSISESIGGGRTTAGRRYANLNLVGVNEEYGKANDFSVEYGRFLNENDEADRKKVAVVSDKLVQSLFGDEDPLGRQITIEAGAHAGTYTIVGVYKYQAFTMGIGTAADEDITTSVYVPLSTAQKVVGTHGYTSVTLLTKPGVNSIEFAEKAESFFDIYYSRNEDFGVSAFSMESAMEQMNSMMGTVQLAISAIAAISLLVGGIGVMNIMLVSITERTREIGTRKAIGATNGEIRLQFIIEAVVICLIGGIIGIILGVGLGALGAGLLGAPARASVPTMLGAACITMLLGVFFGYYPANKAAKLDPIDALRYE